MTNLAMKLNRDINSVVDLGELDITPPMAQQERWSAIDRRTTPQSANGSIQKVKKQVESSFGWMKIVGEIRRSPLVGLEQTGQCGELVTTAYSLVRTSRPLVERKSDIQVFR